MNAPNLSCKLRSCLNDVCSYLKVSAANEGIPIVCVNPKVNINVSVHLTYTYRRVDEKLSVFHLEIKNQYS